MSNLKILLGQFAKHILVTTSSSTFVSTSRQLEIFFNRYTRRNELREYAKELRKLGHTITSQWLMERKDAEMKTEDITAADHRRFAERDLADIDSADIFVGFVQEKKSDKRGGHHVELGWALAKGKWCIIVEEPENTFHYLPQINVVGTFENLTELLAWEVVNVGR